MASKRIVSIFLLLIGGATTASAANIFDQFDHAKAPIVKKESATERLKPSQEEKESVDYGSNGIRGPADVIDGDTIGINGERIRLNGIDALEMEQSCLSAIKSETSETATHLLSLPIDQRLCGFDTKSHLIELTRGKTVTCIGNTKDRYGRRIATCFVGDLNLNAAMVKSGSALAYREFSLEYVAEEDYAREAKQGLWAGEFVAPWDWRRGERLLLAVPVLEELKELHSQLRKLAIEEKFNQAIRVAQEILKIYKEAFGEKSISYSNELYNLATLYREQALYIEAESLLQRAIEIQEVEFGLEHPDIGFMLRILADIYLHQARYVEAEPLLERANQIFKKITPRDNLAIGHVLNDLAALHLRRGNYSDAELLLEEVLLIPEDVFGPESVFTASVVHNVANLHRARGLYDKAVTLYKIAIKDYENVLGQDNRLVALVLQDLADTYDLQNSYDESEQLWVRVLEITEQAFTTDHPAASGIFSRLAIHYAKRGRYADAINWSRRVTTSLRQRFTGQGVEETRGLVSEQSESSWQFLVHLDLALHPEQVGDRGELAAEAFEVMQLARTSSVSAALSRMAARFASDDDEMAQLIRQQQDSLTHYEILDSKLIETLGEPTESRDAKAVSQIRKFLTALEIRLEGLMQSIQVRFPEYAELISREPLSLKATQRLASPGEALLAMMKSSSGDQYHVFVIRSDKSKAYTVELGVDELEEVVTQLRSGLDPSSGRIEAFDVNLAHDLYQKLLAKAEPMLSGVKHLFVVPDGPLESLPFHLLVTEDPGVGTLPGLNSSGQRGFTITSDTEQASPETEAKYQDIAWLAKKYAITTLPSVASLRALRVFAKKGQATQPFIGFGNPVLGGESGDSKGLELASFYRGAVVDVDAIRQLPSLPETEVELKAMANYLGVGESSIYLRERATEANVKSISLDRAQVITFATHGLLSGELKGLAESALVLTPPNIDTGRDNGLLTASEVAQLKLDADWVILSACNTAAGDEPGASGLSGLAKAFFYAGARALLVSHWPVESHAATKLTTTMFEKIKKNPAIGRAEALRQSMLQLASSKDYAHPFFWAPFVVVGEGGL